MGIVPKCGSLCCATDHVTCPFVIFLHLGAIGWPSSQVMRGSPCSPQSEAVPGGILARSRGSLAGGGASDRRGFSCIKAGMGLPRTCTMRLGMAERCR